MSGFNHLHVHLVHKPADLAAELKGAAIFKHLKPADGECLPPDEMRTLCVELAQVFFTVSEQVNKAISEKRLATRKIPDR